MDGAKRLAGFHWGKSYFRSRDVDFAWGFLYPRSNVCFFSEEISMKDDDSERPERETLEEMLALSDRDFEEYLLVEEESTKGEEAAGEGDPPPETLTSLTRQRRSKRSLMLVALFCLGLGVLVLVVLFFVMRPEVRKPQIVAKRMKRPIPSVEREGKPTIPATVGEEAREGALSEGGVPKGEEPAPAKLPGILPVGREGGPEKRVVGTGGTELPEGKEGTEAAGKPEIEGKEEVKPQVAKAEQPETRTIPEGKMPAGRFTVNVGSFRKRDRAERLMKQLEEKGYEAFVAEATIPQKGTWYRVSVGRFTSRGEAGSFAQALKEKEGMDSFVREVKETKE
jgi:cell division septation protein DedD